MIEANMEAYKNHILANQDVRAALLAGNSGAIRDWYNTHAQSTRVISRKLNRDGLLDALGLSRSVSIIAKLRAFATTPHPWAIAAAELIRLIDGGSGPDFGNDEVRLLVGGLKTGVPTEVATEQLPALVQAITEMEAQAMLALPVVSVMWSEHFLGRLSCVDDIDEILRPVRVPGKTTLTTEALAALPE